LTFIGKGVAIKMIDFGTTLAVLKKNETFWLEHDTSGIPDHLLRIISLLADSTILASPQTDIFQVYRRGLAFFEGANAKVLKVVSTTVGAPEADKLLNKLAADQVPMHLVLTDDLLRHGIEHANLVEVQRTLGKRCVVSVLRHDPRLTIAITDSAMVLALPRAGEVIDISHVLLGQSSEAIAWGTALFNHYAETAKHVSWRNS
jgi:predicted transcriptional regulator